MSSNEEDEDEEERLFGPALENKVILPKICKRLGVDTGTKWTKELWERANDDIKGWAISAAKAARIELQANEKVAALRDLLVEKDELLVEKDELLVEKQVEVVALREQLVEKDELLVEKDELLVKKEELLEHYRRDITWSVKFGSIFEMLSMSVTTATFKIDSIKQPFDEIDRALPQVSDTVVENAWGAWLAAEEAADNKTPLPKPPTDKERPYQLYMQAMIKFLIPWITRESESCPWKVLRESSIFRRGETLTKRPDHTLLDKSELFAAASAQMVMIEDKPMHRKGTTEEEYQRAARAQSTMYGLASLIQRVQLRPETESWTTLVVGCTVDKIQLASITLEPRPGWELQAGRDPNTLKDAVVLRRAESEWESLRPLEKGRLDPQAPTVGFKLLMRLLHAAPKAICTPLPRLEAVWYRGQKVDLLRRLGMGGTSDAYLCVWPGNLRSEEMHRRPLVAGEAGAVNPLAPCLAAVKVIRHMDHFNNADILREVEVFHKLAKVQGAPRLIAAYSLPTKSDDKEVQQQQELGSENVQPFLAIAPVGVPLVLFMQARLRSEDDGSEGSEEPKDDAGGEIKEELGVAKGEAAAADRGSTNTTSDARADAEIQSGRRPATRPTLPPGTKLLPVDLPHLYDAKGATKFARVAVTAVVVQQYLRRLTRRAASILPSPSRLKLGLQVVKDVMDTLIGAWEQGIVHTDVRPNNLVVVKQNGEFQIGADGSGWEQACDELARFGESKEPFRVVLIDWATSHDLGKQADRIVGMPAFQSSACLAHLPANIINFGESLTRQVSNFVKGKGYVHTPRDDLEALAYTFTAILHGGDGAAPPWIQSKVCGETVLECRAWWYGQHKAAAPFCPCLVFMNKIFTPKKAA